MQSTFLGLRELAKERMSSVSVEDIFKGHWGYTTIYLLMSQDCNGKCSFCYQPKGFRKAVAMSKEVIDKAMEFIYSNFREDRLKFNLFGGEPFLNFEMLKYVVETYPMARFIVTTNGLLLNNDEIFKWVLSKKNNLDVSFSIAGVKSIYGNNYREFSRNGIEVVKNNGGDVHYVVEDPTVPGVYEEIEELIKENIPVRVSMVRHSETVLKYCDDYLNLFKRVADLMYFTDKPRLGISQWDMAFHNNIYKQNKGEELINLPPTFCGCGQLYCAINSLGEIYPCDFFASFPEFKMGDIYTGFNNSVLFYKKMGEWMETLYEDCKNCQTIPDVRLCPKAMCLAENYAEFGNPLKPTKSHCAGNTVEYKLYDYIAKKAIATGVDKLYNKSKVSFSC